MYDEIDHGIRCDRHAGETFPPRCRACDDANNDFREQEAAERHERAVQRNLALGLTPDCTPRRRNPRRR